MSKVIQPGSQTAPATGQPSDADPEALPQHPTPEIHKLALACWQGACNVRAIVRELAAVLDEIPGGQYRDSLDLKIVIGQLSYLVGDSLGPDKRTVNRFQQQFKGEL